MINGLVVAESGEDEPFGRNVVGGFEDECFAFAAGEFAAGDCLAGEFVGLAWCVFFEVLCAFCGEEEHEWLGDVFEPLFGDGNVHRSRVVGLFL